MLVELNGMSFHVNLSGEDARDRSASIVDEAFVFDPVKVTIKGADCVVALIERYSGMRADDDLRLQVRRQMERRALAA